MLLAPLKQLAVVQATNKKFDLSKETFERAISIGKKCIDENLEKHKDKVGEQLMDIF